MQENDIFENSQIIGNCKAKRFLLNAFCKNAKAPHHSWVISGQKGLGKASFIYEIVQHFLPNLVKKPDMNLSSHPNLFVISDDFQEKKAISVERVRSVFEFFALSASGNAPRFFIIDGADNLTISASNAILKIVEEPPENCYIFLITTDESRILPTIKSRCILLRFLPLKRDESLQLLKKQEIAAKLEEKELNLLLDLSQDAPGKAMEILSSGLFEVYVAIEKFRQNLKKKQAHEIYGFIDEILKKTDKTNQQELFLLLNSIITNLVKKNLHDAGKLENLLKLYEQNFELLSDLEQFSLDVKQNLFLWFNELKKVEE